MSRCILNGCEMPEGATVCLECGELQPTAKHAAEKAYWRQRKPALMAVRRSLAWLGEDALTHPLLHERLLDLVDVLTA